MCYRTALGLDAKINDAIKWINPIIGGLDWLTGSLNGVGSLLDKVSSFTDFDVILGLRLSTM